MTLDSPRLAGLALAFCLLALGPAGPAAADTGADIPLAAGSSADLGDAMVASVERSGSVLTLTLTLLPPDEESRPLTARLPFVPGQRHMLVFHGGTHDRPDLFVEAVREDEAVRITTHSVDSREPIEAAMR